LLRTRDAGRDYCRRLTATKEKELTIDWTDIALLCEVSSKTYRRIEKPVAATERGRSCAGVQGLLGQFFIAFTDGSPGNTVDQVPLRPIRTVEITR
jgi:hypothetical protein